MAIHKIKCDNFVLWTGDDGLKALNKAFKEEVDRQLAIMNEKEATEQLEIKSKGGLNYEQMNPEFIKPYKMPTKEEIHKLFEDYEKEYGPFPSIESYSIDVKRPHWNDEDKEDDEEE